MIPASELSWRFESWQDQLKHAVRDPLDLLERLSLSAQALPIDLSPDFPVRVPEAFIARMTPGDATDPLLRQVLPLSSENEVAPGYGPDPLSEASATLRPGLLQKYSGRALAITTGACAVHCRYCFRRHFPYGDSGALSSKHLAELVDRSDVQELILSGGDPLSLPDTVLAGLLDKIDALPSIRRVRLHTRLPIVIPARVTDHLLTMLANRRTTVTMVVHANHAQELDPETGDALTALKRSTTSLLNQSVLLSGVNDDADTLVSLSNRLGDLGITPYYLHMPDAVAGTQHFDVTDGRARALMADIRGRLPGYLVPRLVREEPGKSSKTVLV